MSQSFHSTEIASVALDDPPEPPPTPNPIISQWQRLASIEDHGSPDFLDLLPPLVAKDSRVSTIDLCDANATVVLDIMERLFRDDKIPVQYKRNVLETMWRLAHKSGQVPSCYRVDGHSAVVESTVIASTPLTDIRVGKLGGRAVAVRTARVDSEADGNKSRELFFKESVTWMTLSHPNILQFIGVDIDSKTSQNSIISEMTTNGNIKEYILTHSANRLHLLEDVAAGLCYLHGREIVHGDLKGVNILITDDTPTRACLAGFKFSTPTSNTEGETTTTTDEDTLLHMAPELLFLEKLCNSSAAPTKPADIYAFGMVIYEVLTGLQPFHDRTWPLAEILHHVSGRERLKKPDDSDQIGFGDGTWELVEECWAADPTKRPTVDEVYTHLTDVAVSSIVVGPTLGVSRGNSPGPDPTEGIQPSDSTTSITQHRTTSSTNLAVPAIVEVERNGNHESHLSNPENPPPASRNNHFPPPDPRIILLQWRNLRNAEPIDFTVFSPLVDIEGNRKIAMRFGEKDAVAVINTIDRALKEMEGPEKVEASEETRLNALRVLRNVAANVRQVPKSYLIGRWTRYSVKKEILATGGFADVREGRLEGRAVAVKTLRISRQNNIKNVHKAFCKESVVWMNVSNPNVLSLIAVEIRPRNKKFSMISEMMTNGSIMKFIRTNKANRGVLLKDVANGLRYLHNNGIVHGDIKAPNILINNENPPKACISDFGLCVFVPSMSFDPTTVQNFGVGTPAYLAPELHGRDSKRTKEADMYSFGMVVYEVITGDYMVRQHGLVKHPVSPCVYGRPDDLETNGFDESTWELVKNCWNSEPEQRPKAGEAWEHFRGIAAASPLVDPSPDSPDNESSSSGIGSSGSQMTTISEIPTRLCC